MDLNEHVVQSLYEQISTKSDRVIALPHLYQHMLQQSRYSQFPEFGSCAADLEQLIEKRLRKKEGDKISAVFEPAAIVGSFNDFYATRKQPEHLYDALMRWLLEGGLNDGLQADCRKICDRHRVYSVRFSGTADDVEVALGFGAPVDDAFIFEASKRACIGREDDLALFHDFLVDALEERRTFLVLGKRGVGKTAFARRLIVETARAIQTRNDFSNVRFLWISVRRDFSSPDDVNCERIRTLYQHLDAHPELVPILDAWDSVLERGGKLADTFLQQFGNLIVNGGRTVVIVGNADSSALRSSVFDNADKRSLSPLDAKRSQEIVLADIENNETWEQVDFVDGKKTFAERLVKVAEQRYSDRHLPGSASSLETRLRRRIASQLRGEKIQRIDVSSSDIDRLVSDELGVDVELLGADTAKYFGKVRRRLADQVKGQDHAIKVVCDSLQIGASYFDWRRRPRGIFLFVGPPGVGKTQLARSLPAALGFGKDRFFKFNMSEYSTEMGRSRFIGSDPGYKDAGKTMTIFDTVRNPSPCVVLLDEIDRADAIVQDVLLSVLEGEGRDFRGKEVFFSQAIFIFTTNQGQEQVREQYNRTRGKSRQDIAAEFSTEELVNLLKKGLLGSAEEHMARALDGRLESLQTKWENHGDGGQPESDAVEEIISYLRIRETKEDLKNVIHKSQLDEALLDRVDEVVPFFPIMEPEIRREGVVVKAKELGVIQHLTDDDIGDIAATESDSGSMRGLELLIRGVLQEKQLP